MSIFVTDQDFVIPPPSSRLPRFSWNASICELKSLEPVQLLLNTALEEFAAVGSATADPAPFLHQQTALLAIRLQIERRHDFVPDQNRQSEIAKPPFLLG